MTQPKEKKKPASKKKPRAGSPESEEEIHDAFLDGVLGIKETTTIDSMQLRPVTLSTIAILQKLRSPLISGEDLDDCPTLVLDTLKFLYCQSADKSEVQNVIMVTLPNGENPLLEEKALELGDAISPTEIPKLIKRVVELIRAGTEAKAVPQPKKSDDTPDLGNE